MRTFKPLTIGILATVMLAASPASRAQTTDELQLMQTFLAIMTDYFGVIESTHEISSNAEKSAILQMQKIQEIYEERGEKAQAAEVLRQVLKESRNPTIRNAAYLLLSDNLKDTGRSEGAIELLREGLTENVKAAQ